MFIVRKLCLVLLICILLPWSALAWGYEDTIAGNMCVEIRASGQWHELTEAMRYSHENGCLADGVLFFMPLDEFVERYEIPSFVYAEDFAYRITCPPFVTTYSIRWGILRQTPVGLTPEGTSFDKLSELEAGRYLLNMYISAEGVSGSCSNQCLFWLDVPGTEPASTFGPTPTPRVIR